MKHRIFLCLLLAVCCLLLAGQVQADMVTLYPDTDERNDLNESGCDAGAHHDCLLDDNEATYLAWSGTGGKYELFSFQDFTEDYSSIDSVVLKVKAKKALSSATIIIGRAGEQVDPPEQWEMCGVASISYCDCENCPQASDTITADQSSYTWYSFSFTCNPCDSSAWTSTNLNYFRGGWGFYALSSASYVSELWITVYYQPPSEGQVIIIQRFDFHRPKTAKIGRER